MNKEQHPRHEEKTKILLSCGVKLWVPKGFSMGPLKQARVDAAMDELERQLGAKIRYAHINPDWENKDKLHGLTIVMEDNKWMQQ